MAIKGNAETNTIKVPGPMSTDKLTPKIRIKPKEKEMVRDSKAKEREEGSHDTVIGRKISTKRTINN